MKQLCNVAFVAQTEWLDEKDFREFLRELNSDPSKGPHSRGADDLMRVMSGAGRGGSF